MGRLSTLVYAPVVFTLITACAPHRASLVDARVNAPATVAKAKAKGEAKPTGPTDGALAAEITEVKRRLRERYFLPVDRHLWRGLPTTWDPADYQAPVRREVEAQLRTLVGLYGQRLAVGGPTPESMLGYQHAEFMLHEFERQDAREGVK